MKKRKLLLYMPLGIEVNNFILSGLATSLAQYFELHALYNYDKSLKLNAILEEYNIIPLKKEYKDPSSRHWCENYFLSIRRARLRLKGIPTVSWKGKVIYKRSKDYLLGNTLLYAAAKKIVDKLLIGYYGHEDCIEFIQKNKITDIMIQSYSTPDVMNLAFAAQKTGCKVWALNWNWKDFYINEWIPFQVSGFFTWNTRLKEYYAAFNHHIDTDIIYAFGNAAYKEIYNYTPKKDKKYYIEKYRLNKQYPIVIYTMMNPDVYNKEKLIIEEILQAIVSSDLDVNFVLKPNPMDKNVDALYDLREKYSFVSVMDNLWEYDEHYNFNLMTYEAKEEWFDLLFYSNAVINVPSTVTVESLLMKKPVINVDFVAKPHTQEEVQLIRNFSKMPYYVELFNREDVIHCTEPSCVIKHLKSIIHHKLTDLGDDSISDIVNINENVIEDITNVLIKG